MEDLLENMLLAIIKSAIITDIQLRKKLQIRGKRLKNHIKNSIYFTLSLNMNTMNPPRLKITLIIFTVFSFTKLTNAQTYSGCLIDNGTYNLLAQNVVVPSANTPATFNGNCGPNITNYDGNSPSQLDYRSTTCYFDARPTGPFNCGIYNVANGRNACGHMISNSTLSNCPLDTETWILLAIAGIVGFVFIRKNSLIMLSKEKLAN